MTDKNKHPVRGLTRAERRSKKKIDPMRKMMTIGRTNKPYRKDRK